MQFCVVHAIFKRGVRHRRPITIMHLRAKKSLFLPQVMGFGWMCILFAACAAYYEELTQPRLIDVFACSTMPPGTWNIQCTDK